MKTLWNDLRFALRVLAKNPVFAAVAVITLALGIGANTAIFSAMNAVLLRSLPVKDADRLVSLRYRNQPRETSQTGFGNRSLSEPAFAALRSQSGVFSDLVAFVPLSFNKVIVRIGSTWFLFQDFQFQLVSYNAFPILLSFSLLNLKSVLNVSPTKSI